MKNVTLSADEELIERSRQRARRERTTLNAVFRKWLARYAGRDAGSRAYSEMMESLSYADSGGPFDRDTLNER